MWRETSTGDFDTDASPHLLLLLLLLLLIQIIVNGTG